MKSPNQQQQSLPSSTQLSFSNEPKQEQSFEATSEQRNSIQLQPQDNPVHSFTKAPDTHSNERIASQNPQSLVTNYDRSTEQYSRTMADLETESPNDINQMERLTLESGRLSDITATTSSSDIGGDAFEPVDLYTDNLPAVDTPDACDKAAVR